MSVENLAAKARRLLSEGRVRVHRIDESAVGARVDGDSGSYRVVWDRSRAPCWCPARGPCSHIEALRLITDGPTRRENTMHTRTTDPGPTEAGDDVEIAPAAEESEPDPCLLSLAKAPVSFQTLRIISETEFVPGALRDRPDAVLAAVLKGRELGLGPMESLARVDVRITADQARRLSLILRTGSAPRRNRKHDDERT